MCLRADATTSAIHVRLILPGECHGDYPPRLCHTPFTRIWPHEELCRFSALDHCSAPFSRACWLALAPPTLLGRGSRHCHGINITHNLGSECKRLVSSTDTAQKDVTSVSVRNTNLRLRFGLVPLCLNARAHTSINRRISVEDFRLKELPMIRWQRR